jgi:phosphoglycolate phosphatase
MTILALFDIDNTLIRSSIGHKRAFLEAVKDVYGLKVDINIINYHGMTDQEIIGKVLRKYNLDEETINSNLKKCMAVMSFKYDEIVKSEKIIILDGGYELLTQLRQRGITLGLVTGNLEKIAWAKLKKIGYDYFFDFGAFGSDHVDRAVLAALAVKRAQEKFGIGRDRKIFLFGDTPHDIRAGKAIDAISIGVTTGNYSREQLVSAGGDKIFENLKNTDRILAYLFK